MNEERGGRRGKAGRQIDRKAVRMQGVNRLTCADEYSGQLASKMTTISCGVQQMTNTIKTTTNIVTTCNNNNHMQPYSTAFNQIQPHSTIFNRIQPYSTIL